MDFSVENYVWPQAAPPIKREAEETVFWFPFKTGDEGAAFAEMEKGFKKLERMA
jgi:hypothetical protein